MQGQLPCLDAWLWQPTRCMMLGVCEHCNDCHDHCDYDDDDDDDNDDDDDDDDDDPLGFTALGNCTTTRVS